MLTLVVALAMSFCVMASADTDTTTVALTDSATAVTTAGIDELTFAVTLQNASSSTAPRPAVTFTYSAVAVTANGPDVTVASSNNSAAFPLVQDGSSLATSTDTVKLTVGSAASVANGEYSYTITQDAVSTPGFGNAAVTRTLTLAVNGGKVTQAVLLKTTTTDDGQGGATTSTTKVAGFDNEYDPTGQIGGDVIVMKTVGGIAAYDSDNASSFDLSINLPDSATYWNGLQITLADASGAIGFNNNNATVTLTAESGAGSASFSGGTLHAVVNRDKTSWESGLGAASQLTISGLPVGSTVTVKDKTNDGQKIQSYQNSSGNFVQSVGKDESAGFVTSDSSGTTVTTTANAISIEYFALREAISLTGVTLRYAPYLLTLGAGITVLPLSRRYKKREEDV